jgi:hypothetical protein
MGIQGLGMAGGCVHSACSLPFQRQKRKKTSPRSSGCYRSKRSNESSPCEGLKVASLTIALGNLVGSSRSVLSDWAREREEEELEARQASSPERQRIPERVRHEVWRRDQGMCVDCGSRERLEFDHIIPVSKGCPTQLGISRFAASYVTGRRAQ